MLFPKFVDEEERRVLMEVSKDEIKIVLLCFQKDKISGLDNLIAKLFLGLYEFIGNYLLLVIE